MRKVNVFAGESDPGASGSSETVHVAAQLQHKTNPHPPKRTRPPSHALAKRPPERLAALLENPRVRDSSSLQRLQSETSGM